MPRRRRVPPLRASLLVAAGLLPRAALSAAVCRPQEPLNSTASKFSCRGTLQLNESYGSASLTIAPNEYLLQPNRSLIMSLRVASDGFRPSGTDEVGIALSAVMGSSFFTFQSPGENFLSRMVCHSAENAPVKQIGLIASSVAPTSLELEVNVSETSVHPVGKALDISFHHHHRAWFEVFYIPREVAASGEVRIHVEVDGPADHNLEMYVYSQRFNEKTRWDPCSTSGISSCADADKLAECLGDHKMSSLKVLTMSVSRKATMPIGADSLFPLEEGYLVMVLKPVAQRGPLSAKVVVLPGSARAARFWRAGALITLVPGLAVAAFACCAAARCQWRSRLPQPPAPTGAASAAAAARPTTAMTSQPPPCFASFIKRRLKGAMRGSSYATQVLIAASAFFTAAFQSSAFTWHRGWTHGDRNACRYNYECYHTVGLDMPFNNILSHVPYLVCGLLTLYFVARRDYGLSRKAGLPELDLRVFYALGMAEIMETGGSLCYHICPQKVQFPTDGAMMFVIVLLSALALSDSDRATADVVPPQSLFLVLVLPLWLASIVGTWFNLDLVPGPAAAYVAYCVCLSCWFAAALWRLSVLFPLPGGDRRLCGSRSRGLTALRIFVCGVSAVVIFSPRLDVRLGGTPKVLLGLCCVVTIIALSRQVIRHNLPLAIRDWRSGRRWALAADMVTCAVSLVTGAVAASFFRDSPYNSGGPPWESHDANQPCILLGTFDRHDVWHMWSAVALAFWTLFLCEARVRIWEGEALQESAGADGSGVSLTEEGHHMPFG